MLVLSRKKDEKIIIGDGLITILIVEVRGDKVRIAIDAPRELSVHREEIYLAKLREGRAAAGAVSDSED